MSKLEHLKIKIASLAAESKIIRKHEKKALNSSRWCRQTLGRKKHGPDDPKPDPYKYPVNPQTGLIVVKDVSRAEEEYNRFWGLRKHRTEVVRREARASHLAAGFLKEQPYEIIEQKQNLNGTDWERLFKSVESIASRFWEDDTRIFQQRFEEWVQSAREYAAKGLVTQLS